jgi:hypothetical protein
MLRIPHCLDSRLTVNCKILATCSSTYSPVRTSQETRLASVAAKWWPFIVGLTRNLPALGTIVLEKLAVAHMLKKFLALYGTPKVHDLILRPWSWRRLFLRNYLDIVLKELRRPKRNLSQIFRAAHVTVLCSSDPSSRQRGRYKITNPQLSKGNFKEKEKLVAGPKWAADTKTDWQTDRLTDCQ